MTHNHWTLSEEEKKKLKGYEAVEAKAESNTENERLRRALLMQKERIEAKKRQQELEQKTEGVKRARKVKSILGAASERIFSPEGPREIQGEENKKSMQKLNSVGGKA